MKKYLPSVVASGCIWVSATLEENLSLIGELGYKALDLLMVSGWAHVDLNRLAEDYGGVCKRVEGALSRNGLMLASVNTKYSVRLEDEASADQRQREFDALMAFMKDFGVNRLSIQPTLTGDTAYLARTASAAMAEAARQQEMAASRGFLLSVEPHIMSCVCENKTVKQAMADFPGLCFTADPSHLLHSGEEMNTLGYLFDQATIVHLRDADAKELFLPYGQGKLDLPFVMERLCAARYDGPIALEYISDNRDDAMLESMAVFRAAVEDAVTDAYSRTE